MGSNKRLKEGSLVLTLRASKIQIWPPPGRRSWQYVFTWGLTFVSFGGTLALGLLGWNSFILEHCLRLPIGLGPDRLQLRAGHLGH